MSEQDCKQRVLAVYPDAEESISGAIYTKSIDFGFDRIGLSWADAASRLKSEDAPPLADLSSDLDYQWPCKSEDAPQPEKICEHQKREGEECTICHPPSPVEEVRAEPAISDKQMCALSVCFNRFASVLMGPNDERTINQWLKWNIERI